jgi:hypothetical protein
MKCDFNCSARCRSAMNRSVLLRYVEVPVPFLIAYVFCSETCCPCLRPTHSHSNYKLRKPTFQERSGLIFIEPLQSQLTASSRESTQRFGYVCYFLRKEVSRNSTQIGDQNLAVRPVSESRRTSRKGHFRRCSTFVYISSAPVSSTMFSGPYCYARLHG